MIWGRTKRGILRDKGLDLEFSRNGYLKVPFFTPEEAEEFRSLIGALNDECKALPAAIDTPYALSFFAPDAQLKRRIFDRVTSFVMPKVDQIVADYLPLVVNIFDKEPGTGEVALHQNWTFVDESRFDSITIWIPTLDVSRRNGTVEAIPGSHKSVSKYRSPSIPWVFREIVPQLQKYCQPLGLKFGEAALLYDSMLHRSSDNHSDRNRAACQVILHPREAKTIHYHLQPQSPRRLEVFGVDHAFFQRYDPREKPTGVPSLGTIPFRLETLDEAELVRRVARHNPAIRRRTFA